MRPCTRPIKQHQCGTYGKPGEKSCGAHWLSDPAKPSVENFWCPNCGRHSSHDADLAFMLENAGCVGGPDE